MNPITKARERLNITQAELARRSGLPYQRIWSLERGARSLNQITLETASRLAKALNISIDDLAHVEPPEILDG